MIPFSLEEYLKNPSKKKGSNYDMQWHKGYCEQLNNACETVLKKLR